jgi:hypothetical protein
MENRPLRSETTVLWKEMERPRTEVVRVVVPPVVHELAVAPVRRDQDIPVDEGIVIVGGRSDRLMARVDDVERAVAPVDPVVSHHQLGGAVLEVVAWASGAQGAEAVVLVDDPLPRRVGVVLIDAVDHAIVEEMVPRHEGVPGLPGDEEPVARVVDHVVPDGDVIAGLEEDGRGVVRVYSGASVRVGEAVLRAGTRDVQALDHDVLGRGDRRHAASADLDDPALLAPVVELLARHRIPARDLGQPSVLGHAQDHHGLLRGRLHREHPLVGVGGVAPVNANEGARPDGFPRYVRGGRQVMRRPHIVDRREVGRIPSGVLTRVRRRLPTVPRPTATVDGGIVGHGGVAAVRFLTARGARTDGHGHHHGGQEATGGQPPRRPRGRKIAGNHACSVA